MGLVRLMRLPVLLIALPFVISDCRRSRTETAESSTSSLIFGTAPPEAQQALATPVNFRLTEANFAQWEEAQRNLDALPRSALPSGGSSAGNPIDRAVERLESSPKARTAIERTGLTVRDFVLETVALAQATEAMATANSSSSGQIPPENLQFVQSHRARVLLARRQRQASEEQVNNEPVNVDVAPTPATPETTDTGVSQKTDSAKRPTTRSEQRVQQRDTVAPKTSQPPKTDSVKDTIPTLR